MDKKLLQAILSSSFSDTDWLNVLRSVFGARQLLQQPKPILLPNTEKADAAYELGSITTSDDRIIGLYKIEVKPKVWLERNKVGLRELLRSVYKYDVDGAIIVFVQHGKWRLSFVSEIKVLNDEGEVIEQATEPKRYTYLLGNGEKVRTPADRLHKLAGKTLSLQDILNAFSVEALNEEFYKIIQAFFYELIGGKTGKGRKMTDYGEGILRLPAVPKQERQVYQEFAVRLIGRTVFCWFLKMKKSDAGEPLLPDTLLSSAAVYAHPNYYHSILERLFFQTLNTPMQQRIEGLPEGAAAIPFLNGGLFEPDVQDYFKPDSFSGLSKNINTLLIADDWFSRFFTELEKYNFTIDENSVTDIEVSVDPEMLGRIFENLLAEIDPDSGETARKATGSFYTPREIVDYMATESLVQYLHNKTEIEQDKLRPVFKLMEAKDPEFSTSEREKILNALDEVKILDPACGSGAFPMGVLQKIVQALQKLDPDAEWWKNRQVSRINNAIVRKQLKEKLEASGVEYARKIGVIQNSLYGVDIQPVAAEISKLRCFLTLVVDESINDSLPNRGIEPLPNLEFKFVTADTLIKLPAENNQIQIYDESEEKNPLELLSELEEIRQEYLQSYGEHKNNLKEQFKNIQEKIAKQQIGLGRRVDPKSRAYLISSWNPFGHDKSDWFDPKWMFGVEKFDVVIGNPPYIKEYTNKAAFDGIRGNKYYQGKMDIWYYFASHLFDYLTKEGNLTFIATNNWVTNAGASKFRDKITNDCEIIQLIDFGNTKVFSSADIQTMILIAEKKSHKSSYKFEFRAIESNTATLKDSINMLSGIPGDKYFIAKQIFDRDLFRSKNFVFNTSINDTLLNKIKKKENFKFHPREEIAQGIVAPQDFLNRKNKIILGEKFIEGQGIFNLTIEELNSLNLTHREKLLIKPFYTTSELKRFHGKRENKLWIIYTDSRFKRDSEILPYPNIKNHLDQFRDVITSDNWPYGLHRARDERFFKGEKIVSLRKCSDRPTFTYTDFDTYVSQTYYIIKTERISNKYLTGLLNSKLIEFWLRYKGKMQGFNFQIDKVPILNIPIYKPAKIRPFEIIVDYIITVLKDDININSHVPNSHISQLFEDVIDAMVMELYFKEDFEKAGIEFIKYAERDFENIEGKQEFEQAEIIHRAYQMLREKDNEIRNNLKLMDIKLADIVAPIKAAK
ncbi:MAG: N-6 DNA methylase [Candidatus Cyclonatronum sp.]|uniref:Eco57I restriction-modification methylase domain-containing protein n=1 Tax=Cyclonatronum sp. TaxID=3024185 RepID=UPI0025BF8784|nr:N-6 DNA methylase [Cyclonatronum sp.]MCH8486901.1 N-6 DNA methylase [Cyclonatronum sp.]